MSELLSQPGGRMAQGAKPNQAEPENCASARVPRVSIGLPVYNGEAYLEQELDSLLGQTFCDFELIISDNGSGDRTEQICRNYTTRDKRIRYFRSEANRGAAWNFNYVFSLARGEYFKWAAADDVLAPEFLAQCVTALDHDPDAVLACTGVVRIDEEGRHLYTVAPIDDTASIEALIRFRRLSQSDYGCEQVFGVIRSSVLRNTKLIGKYWSSDRVLLSHLALLGHFALIPELLLYNRKHSKNSASFYPGRQGWTLWFDPSVRGHKVFPSWREFIEYIRVIAESPLASQDRLRCYVAMIVWVRHHWRVLIWDLLYYPKEWSVRRVPGARAAWTWLKAHKLFSETY